MSLKPLPDAWRSNYLFLLVGANPLPNYVAARLLAREFAIIYLLHSGEPKGTFEVARRLKARIEADCPTVKAIRREIDETDGEKIEKQVKAILKEITPRPDPESIGLNYTSGTKPMAVHTYRILKQAFPQGCFSYIDARSLCLIIRKGDDPIQKPPVGLSVTLGLDGLVKMHGYELSHPRREPEYPDFFLALAKVHSDPESYHEWKGGWDKYKKSKGWLRTGRPLTELPTRDQYPNLTPIIDIFDQYDGDPLRVAHHLGFNELDSCYKWFNGTWLEEYTLYSLKQFVNELNIKHFGMNLSLQRTGDRPFELDVAAMYGYQLFAISCIATDDSERAEEHLFEAFIRAHQLGGDEARYALVCCVQTTTPLLRRIERSWDAEGKVRVYGMRDLPHLTNHLKQWFTTANKE